MRSPAAFVGWLDRMVPMSTSLLPLASLRQRHSLRARSLASCVRSELLAVPPSARFGLAVARLLSDRRLGETP